MAFKFPVLKPKTIDCSGLPVHDFKCLTNKEIIGKGAYGAVFTANWQTVPDAGGKSAAAEKVVVKKLLGEDILDKKTFVITYVCILKLIVFQLLFLHQSIQSLQWNSASSNFLRRQKIVRVGW